MDENIIRFVRETLGCRCPDEVFEQIELARQPEINSPLDAKIIVGGRLLIYIASVDDISSIDTGIEKLVHEGIKERDSSGLNRFRLVIAADDPNKVEAALTQAFESIRGSDEKLHLHVIARSDRSLSHILV